MTGQVLVEVADAAGWVTISNPARRNALSVSMMGQLDEALRNLDADPAVHVIVLRGEGTAAFAAGADISEFESKQASDEAWGLADKTVTSLFGCLDDLATPLIAMIHGYCYGAGVAIALGADIRIAADDSRFAIPAAKLGVGYPVPLAHALQRVVGPGYAAEMLFTGESISAREALDAGLVNRLLPPRLLEEATRKIVRAIAANAPLTVRAAKAALRAAHAPGRRAAAEALTAACADSADAREGHRAFLEKRPPRFQGS